MPRPSSLSTSSWLPCSSSQLLADREAQAGAAVLHADVVAGLGELLEDVRQPVRRDADPGVGDPEVARDTASASQLADLQRRPSTEPFAVNLMALPSRLVSTCPILTGSPRGGRQPLVDLDAAAASPFSSAFTLRPSSDAVDQLRGGRTRRSSSDDLAGLDLAEVEDVVDQAEQVLRGRAEDADVLLLLRGELGAAEQVRDAR